MIKIPFRSLKKFSVLVGTPHHEVKNYALDTYLPRVTNLTYPNYNILVADNSPTRKNYKMLSKQGIECVYVKPKAKTNQQYIAESHEALRLEAIRRGVDFLLHYESDEIPPHDIIERLMVHQLPVVSAMYFIDEGHYSHLMLQEIEDRGDYIRDTRNIDGGEDILVVDGTVKRVYACGLGMTLIHKDVFTRIKFRWERGISAHPDTFFAADLNALGIPQYLDTSILCEHRNTRWATVLDSIIMPTN